MRRINLSLFLILVVSGFVGQTYNFTHYNEEKGLNQSYIYCITQSREGHLILSTGETVSSFDGTKFNAISNKDLSENLVSTHFTDSQNGTWIAHQQQGLSCIRNGKYYRFIDKVISSLKVSQITEDKKGNIWMASSGGLVRIDTRNKVKLLSLPGNLSVNVMYPAVDGNLILGTTEGLFICGVNEDSLAIIKSFEKLNYLNIKQIVAVDPQGSQYWVLTDGNGIYGLSHPKQNYEISNYISSELGAKNLNISSIYSDRSKNLWVSLFGEGLRKLSFKEHSMYTQFSVEKIAKENGLKSENIQCVFEDREGNMWFGTFGDGLIKKPVELFSFYGASEGIQSANIAAITNDGKNTLWLATDKGLASFNPLTKVYRLYNASNGFVNDKVNALISDDKGVLWLGTNENGIYRVDPAAMRFENISKKKQLKQMSVNSLIQIKNKIMAGTRDGLCVFDRYSDWKEELTTSDGLFHNNIQQVFKDSKERVWISSHGTPPYYIQEQKISSFKKIKGLDYFKINAVCEDKEGNIWIATDGDGVFKYDNKDFQQYTTAESLVSDYCVGIETDKNNSVWVSHRSGLSELKERHEKFIGFTSHKGLLYHENNLNAIHKDADKNLWFGTNDGIVSYDATSSQIEATVPELFISKVQLNNEAFDPSREIRKKYGYYSVRISYKAISLTDPGAIFYQYRLVETDTNYQTTDLPYVDFPKLGDGKYTLEVIACDANTGLCSAAPVKVMFVIEKPFWKEIWFYLALSFCFVVLVHLFVFLRTRSLKKTKRLLELKIEQKTFLLKREKEAVEIIKVQLENRNKDITDSIHYAKNIQDSLLPPDELMSDLFQDNYFVIYKPKDIVSGDFYWCAGPDENNNFPLHLAAVIDCTGHGVPGAFLSILANDFLKQTVAEKNVNRPDEILNYLNESVSSHLNQQWSKNKIRDGMDIALIGIDYKEMKLYYSGANNPIYLFRQGENGVEEQIVKATKQAIGSVNEVISNYELNVIDLKKGDTIYLFSDGYADQFGGPRNKKITYKSFRAILAQSFHLPMLSQKSFIESKLEDWKQSTEQTDDVCVMGIRI